MNDFLLFFSGDPLYVGMDLTIASFDSISEVNMVSPILFHSIIIQLLSSWLMVLRNDVQSA